ncbi:protein of unknown function [Agreia sp. COWG]|nr:protein of unknown function [Agreia sp. COWG]
MKSNKSQDTCLVRKYSVTIRYRERSHETGTVLDVDNGGGQNCYGDVTIVETVADKEVGQGCQASKTSRSERGYRKPPSRAR